MHYLDAGIANALFGCRDSQCIIWMQGHPKTVWDSLFRFRIPLVCLAGGIAIKFQIHKILYLKKFEPKTL